MAEAQQEIQQNDAESSSEEEIEEQAYYPDLTGEDTHEIVSAGVPFETIVNICPQPPDVIDMAQVRDRSCTFMIAPFKYDPLHPELEPRPVNSSNHFHDYWDRDHVRMPCSPRNVTRDRRSRWPLICKALSDLKKMCDSNTATVEDLKRTVEDCVRCHYDMGSLEKLINEHYDDAERSYFMSNVLSNICLLASNVDVICSRSLPLLRARRNASVTLSQRQVASLLACEFFCLFPYRSDRRDKNRFGQFPKLNFHRLYRSGPPKNIEKLKCILHYFRRITEYMPTGVITIQRCVLPDHCLPHWSDSTKGFCDVHLTTGKRIEEIYNVLQVDFANKFIGGGVLGTGCVQEEIRFVVCPEMLVSLLVCEVMEPNECVFLIGCEQYATYQGYSDSFKFGAHYEDQTPKDNWGRKWCHLVAMDAIYFRDLAAQYDMHCTDRELLKAYTSFRPLGTGPNYQFGIATGNWGCGAFHGDKQLKAIIQLMAASEAGRPLIYTAYRDRNIVLAFALVLDYLKEQNATVGDLYRYLQRYCTLADRGSLFDFMMTTPVASLKS